MFLGSWKIDDYVPIPVTCHRFSSGAAYAPSALTYSIYEDSTDVGIAEDVDMTPASPFDSVVGFYLARPQLTAASGFEKGKNYTVLIKATVDSISAIATHTFQIEAEVDANVVSGSVLLQATQTGVTIPTVTTVTNGVTLADDAITNAKFDETSAFPVKSADTGATQIARVGADSDTLETLSDQIDATALEATLTAMKGVGWTTETLVALKVVIDAILLDTGTTLPAEHAALPTAAEIVAAIGASVNANAAVATALVVHDSDSIYLYRDITNVISFAGLGDVSAYTAAGDIAWLTVKENLDDADTASILQMKTTSFGDSGAASTLTYVNGAAPTASDEGSFLFSDYVTGAAAATLKAVASADLPIYAATPVYWDIKVTTAAGVVTILAQGTSYIYGTATKSIT
jgi:hypothetical protein